MPPLEEDSAPTPFDDMLAQRIASAPTATITLPIGISAAEAVQALTLATLKHYNHRKERTAAALGISLKTLYNRLREYAGESGEPIDLDTDR